MRTYALLLLAAVVSLGFAPAPLPNPPRPEPSKEDLKKMQGAWVRVVLSNQAGAGGAVARDTTARVVIANNRMSYSVSGKVMSEWFITLDAKKAPKVFDNEAVGREGPYRGIYRLEGDTLTICSRPGSTEKDRPTNLAGPRPGVVLEVLVRERP
jgi:uncharacterized protein (TIGR03067 family)